MVLSIHELCSEQVGNKDQLNGRQLYWCRHSEIHPNLLFANPTVQRKFLHSLNISTIKSLIYQRRYQVTVIVAHHSDLLCLLQDLVDFLNATIQNYVRLSRIFDLF